MRADSGKDKGRRKQIIPIKALPDSFRCRPFLFGEFVQVLEVRVTSCGGRMQSRCILPAAFCETGGFVLHLRVSLSMSKIGIGLRKHCWRHHLRGPSWHLGRCYIRDCKIRLMGRLAAAERCIEARNGNSGTFASTGASLSCWQQICVHSSDSKILSVYMMRKLLGVLAWSGCHPLTSPESRGTMCLAVMRRNVSM